jgi:hypothetical protein
MLRDGWEDRVGDLFMDADDVSITSHDENGPRLREAHKCFASTGLPTDRFLVEEARRP